MDKKIKINLIIFISFIVASLIFTILLTVVDVRSSINNDKLGFASINENVFYADFEDNSSAKAFSSKLESGSIEVDMHDYGSFEKVGALPWTIERNDKNITTEPGDVILYQGNQITIYYDENSWSFTRLAKIRETSKKELLEVLGDGSVTVRFSLEYR